MKKSSEHRTKRGERDRKDASVENSSEVNVLYLKCVTRFLRVVHISILQSILTGKIPNRKGMMVLSFRITSNHIINECMEKS